MNHRRSDVHRHAWRGPASDAQAIELQLGLHSTMKLNRNVAIGLAGTIFVLLLAGLVYVTTGQQGTQSAWIRALGLPAAMALMLILALGARALILARLKPGHGQSGHDHRSSNAPISDAVRQASEAQSKRAGEFVDRIADPERRKKLQNELSELRTSAEAEFQTLNIVVFGTVSAGKTSLINALLQRKVGATEAVMGTTRAGETHTYELKSVDARVSLTDTPGLCEAGEGGDIRERDARALAVRADLLLFVIDHDLIRGQYVPLIELARLGKRSIVVLNKKDLFPPDDLAQILEKLRQRLAGVVEAEDIVAVAAAPRPLPVRVTRPDGSHETVLEVEEPDMGDLLRRIVGVLRNEGRFLHAANLLVRGRIVEQEAREQIASEQELQALAVVERFQWTTAGTVFANPIPALDVLAGGAVQIEMIGELARVFGVQLTATQIRGLAGKMVQSIVKLGLPETAASLIAGIFKRTLVGFAAGGAVQAVTMAYLTRVSGKAIVEYFKQGQTWSDGSIDATVLRQFQETSRTDFLQDFASQVVHRVLEKLNPAKLAEMASAATSRVRSKENRP